MGDWVLLAYDVALKVHAHFDGLARLRGCTAPDAIAVFFELANAGEAMCFDPRFRLTLREAISPGNRSTRVGWAVRSVHCRGVCIAVRRRARLLRDRRDSDSHDSHRKEKFAHFVPFCRSCETTTRLVKFCSIWHQVP